VNSELRKFLVPFLIVDAVFFLALAAWFFGRPHVDGGKPDLQVQFRHPEAKLTEIDLVNNGNAPGSLFISVNVSWPDAELLDAKGLSQFNEIDSGRYSVRFYPTPGVHDSTLAPGVAPFAVGWVKLTDDVPLHAEISSDVTTQP
jgi:hypothetical protein